MSKFYVAKLEINEFQGVTTWYVVKEAATRREVCRCRLVEDADYIAKHYCATDDF